MNIRIENGDDGRGVRLRVAGAGKLLDKPEIVIRWHGANRILGPNGWGETHHTIGVSQRLDGNDLILNLEPTVAAHIGPSRPVELEIPTLRLSYDAFLWPTNLGPGLATIIPAKGGAGAVSPPADPTPPTASDDKPPRTPTQPPPPPPPTSSARTEVETGSSRTSQASDGDTTEPEKAGSSANPVKPARRRLAAVAASLIFFVFGAAAGAVGLRFYQINYMPSPRAQAQPACDTDILIERAYAPLTLGLKAIATKSPRGVAPEEIAKASDPDRARTYYNTGAKISGGSITDEGVFWFRQAVRLCDAPSMFALGQAYWVGRGVQERDPVTGLQLLRMAAALGNPTAIDYLVRVIGDGSLTGAPKSFAKRYERQR